MKSKAKQKTFINNMITYAIVVVAYIVVQILMGTGHMSSLMKGLLVPFCIYVIMAVSLNLTVGILGELSLGHAGFMCVGAFVGAFFTNVAADAKTVCDYINKNYLLGQLSPATTVDFDVVASNADWFTGTLSTDSTALVAGRTVWGIVQQRTSSVENSTLYKYFASGTGGAGSVSPFKSYDQGYAQGVTDADNRANANSTNYKTGYNNGYNAGKSDGALTGVSGCCIAGWRSIDAYSNNQWVSGWTGVNPNYFTVNGYGIVPKRNFTATVYWQGYNKRDIDFYSNGVMGHRDNGTSMNGVKMNFYAGTQCGFKTNDSGGGSLGAGFIVLN